MDGVRDTCRRRQTVMTAWWNILKVMKLSSTKMALSLVNIPAPVEEAETLLHKTISNMVREYKGHCAYWSLYLKHCWAWTDDQNGQKELVCHWLHHAWLQPEIQHRRYTSGQKYGHKLWVFNSQQLCVHLFYFSEYFNDYHLHCTLTKTCYMGGKNLCSLYKSPFIDK